jgi:hypothetical protein
MITHVSNLYAHYYLSRIYDLSSPVCNQDRVNGVFTKNIPFARKGKNTTLPHPPVMDRLVIKEES